MPQVPVYDRPQVAGQVLQGGEQRASTDPGAFGAIQVQQLQQASQALASVAEVVDRVDQREDRRIADETEAAVRRDWTQFDLDARQKLQGNRIGEYKGAAENWWKEAPKKYAKAISPRAKSMIDVSMRTTQDQAMASALGHYAAVTERNQDVAFESNMLEQMDWAINQGSAAAVNATRDKMEAIVAARGTAKGWDAATIAQTLTKYNSRMTVDYVSQLVRKDPKAAESYLARAQEAGHISGDAYTKMANEVGQVGALVDGKTAAAEVWKSTAPKDLNAPVDIAAMEQAVRDKYPNDAARQAAGVAALKEYAAAHNASQKEFNAANTNAVYDMLLKKTPMTTVQTTKEWRSLPGKERDAIMQQQETRAATVAARAASEASRAFSESGRALAEMERANKKLMLTNAESYLEYTDPEKLGAITNRKEVEATIAKFGPDGAKHLLDRWDNLQSAKGRIDAKIDKDDFENIATSMGLNTQPRKGTPEAAALGDLHYRAEQVILAAQRAAGAKPLTREEKADAVRKAVATQVLVDPGVFRSNRNVSVMSLTADQIKGIVIPAAELPALQAKLQEANKKAGGLNPADYPTEENIRRLYLRGQVPTPTVMPNAK